MEEQWQSKQFLGWAGGEDEQLENNVTSRFGDIRRAEVSRGVEQLVDLTTTDMKVICSRNPIDNSEIA